MGLSRWAYWLTWILSDMIVQMASTGLQVTLLFFDFFLFYDEDGHTETGQLVKHGDITMWAVFLALYACAAVSFCAFIASFSKRGILVKNQIFKSILFKVIYAYLTLFYFPFFSGILASYVGATVWLLSYYFSDLFLRSYNIQFASFAKICMCLAPNAALILGITLMLDNGEAHEFLI